jgi:hypothetical protein
MRCGRAETAVWQKRLKQRIEREGGKQIGDCPVDGGQSPIFNVFG